MRSWILGTLILLAGACGEKRKPPPPAPAGRPPAAKPAGTEAEPEKADPQAAERAQARRAQLDELRNRKSGLTATVNGLRDTLRALDKRHAEETKDLADPRQLRPFLMRLRQDSATASGRLHTMERQYEELEQTVAKTKVSGELKQLQDKLKEVEERYWEAHSGWVASREEAKFSPIEESPVKRELDVLRAVRTEWLRVTPTARRGSVAAKEGKIINDAFRAWMNEQAERKKVVGKILGKDPTGYDFTGLEFFLRLSVRELELDKLNIVEEKKVLDESKKKLEAIEKEMDQLRDQVAAKLSEGGGDLERYQDLGSRMDEQRKKAAELERMAEEYQQIFADIEATKERHLEEQDEAARALEAAEKELREVDKELRRLQRLGR
jgi:DNA repair exonuclease SbcCD ATPase subunit